MKKFLPLTLAFIAVGSLYALIDAPEASTTKIVITGSSTIAPLASTIAKEFESTHPKVRVDVQSGGSSRGISDTRSGLADIGLVSRALKTDEHDLFVHQIAIDGIAIIVHSDNPIKELTSEQITEIYTGSVRKWSDVGGTDAPITVISKAEGRSTLELFLDYFKLTSSSIKPDMIIGENEQGIKAVAGNPNAIGYVSIGSAEYSSSQGVPIKLLPLNGIPATVENLQQGKFPIFRPLNLVTKSPPSGLVRDYIDFAQSSAVIGSIERHYFVSSHQQ